MSGDYSRKRFDPEKHYQGVLRQQGRVDLDADWNEYVDLQDRRWRAETIDVVGRCGVPSDTPDGFKIALTAGQLTVGQGRIYVDGFLAENHGANPQFDATLEEEYGTAALPANDQPYGAETVQVAQGGRSLVYLDVWRREVTYLQEPGLIEPAVNVDTTTRTQTAWRVRILDGIDPGVTCQTALADIAAWLQDNPPAAARMSTSTVAVTAEPDPCLVPPSGGYRGLENHLYRVEVHDATAGGALLVKWSRENGHVATNVIEVLSAGKTIRVESLGRDDVLRFKTGDWVEITNDTREFGGLPGEMRKVTVDDANRTLSFDVPLPPAEFPDQPADPADHFRVIRWDHSGSVRRPDGSELINLDTTPDGLIPLTLADPSFVLEHGIQVTFSVLSGGTARTGDYWCFAARTADADIERLDAAAPAGIHHHFCKLAIIEPDGTVGDCRPVFPPLTELTPGCCTVVVRPGDDIQAAIDSLPDAGGCVCLKVGEHEIHEPLRIPKSNVTLHGESLGARVVRSNGAALLQIGHPNSLLLENVTVIGIGFASESIGVKEPGLPALLAVDRCQYATIHGCTITAQSLQSLVGILIGRSGNIQVSENRIAGVSLGLWVASDSTLVSVERNAFNAVTDNNQDGGIVGVFLMDAFGPCRVEANQVSGFIYGVGIDKGLLGGTPNSLAGGSAVTGNRIVRFTTNSEASDEKAFGIEVAAANCVIRDNVLLYAADIYGGIAASGADAVVEGNRMLCAAEHTSASPSLAVLVGALNAQGVLGSRGGRVARNSVLGPQDGIVFVGNSAGAAVENRIDGGGSEARFGILMVGADRACVQGNRITGAVFPIAASQGTANSIVENTLWHGGGGVTLVLQTGLEFRQNRVEDMRNWGLIGLNWLAKAVLTENRFLSCSYQQAPAIGIGVSQHFGELHIESCEVMNTGVSPDNATISPLAWGIFADYVLEARVQSNNVTYANAALMDANQEHRALWLRGWLEQVINLAATQLVFGFSAQILDNKFLGPGRSALIETAQQSITDTLMRRFERVFFNNNFCWHVSVPAQPAATVSLVGRSAIVIGNHIKTNVLIPSVDFHGMKDAVYMGNIAQTPPMNFGGIPNPPPGFNRP
jgi:hypothetical protein